MARPPRGKEVLALAQQQLAKTSDASELRALQAVVLPLVHGFSTQETAAMVGRSPRWVTAARNGYINSLEVLPKKPKKIRNNAYMSIDEEAAFLASFLEKARCGGVLVVNEIHHSLQERLGHPVALATAYNLLHRHGWRKLAPDKRNVAADPQAQDDWKKNSQSDLLKSKKNGKSQGRSG
ncbi:winged helix-turn-helix domain-containing protein [Desulfovibrio sp. OttesenSCG-928-F20]|nr:winged helix-turn-helix domain-containing protein [Desulfovibrio sp. OttesenSCG-928-F20]